MAGPTLLPVDPVEERLVGIYQDAERALSRLIEQALRRGALGTGRYLSNQQRSVERILERMQAQAAPLRGALPRSGYVLGASVVDRMVERSTAFSGVHAAAVDVLAGNLEGRLRHADEFVGRMVNDVFRRIALETTAETIAIGRSARDQRRIFEARMRQDGITGFVDRAGRRWKLSNYARMVTRTTTREAFTAGMGNRLREAGLDLVTISTHHGSCPICLPYQGKTYSLTGNSKNYPKAPVLPPIHPNCRHVAYPARHSFEEFERALGLASEAQASGQLTFGALTGEEPIEPDPSAVNVSERLNLRLSALGEEKHRVHTADRVGAIERVHTLPPEFAEGRMIPVEVGHLSDDARLSGQHQLQATVVDGLLAPTKEELRINVRSIDDNGYNSVAHEFGHALDAWGLRDELPGYEHFRKANEPEFHSTFDEEWAGWREAISKTETYRKAVARDPDYLGSWRELWARSYDQWIARRSGDASHLAQIAEARARLVPGSTWGEEEFKPVAEAIDAIFRKRGLLRF